FDKYAAQVPKPSPKGVEARFSRMGKNLEITVSGVSKGDALDFYPVPRDDLVVGHVTRNGLKLSLPIESETKTLDRMEGILVVGSGETRQGSEIKAATVLVNAQTPAASASLVAILQALVFALIGGVILNIMPCVLPVISLKVFGFVSEAGERPEKAF